MKVRDTSQGRMYAISSEIGCTAINGAMAIDIPAGGQSVILALDKKIVIDGDDDAKFVEVRWGTNTAVGSRPVPSWLSDVLAGLISITGDDNFDINYIPAENKLVVHTDRVDDTQFAAVTTLLERVVPKDLAVEQYNHHIEVSWRDINRFAEFTDGTKLLESIPNQCLGDLLTSDGWWVYPAPKLASNTYSFFSKGTKPSAVTNVTHVVVDGGMLGDWGGYWVKCAYVWSYSRKLEYVKLTNYKPTYGLGWFEQCSNLRHAEIDYSLMTRGTRYIFNKCQLDKESVLLLNNLPPTTERDEKNRFITLGIHRDLKDDPKVMETIDNIKSKGLDVDLQWNPVEQTATTYGLRKPPIYARVDERELPDGTTERYLAWGHYVTNWEERGYEEFRSLESAYEYFGLEPEVETEPPTEE